MHQCRTENTSPRLETRDSMCSYFLFPSLTYADSVPPKIIDALQKYVCLGRPLSNEWLPGGTPRLKAFHLDECIFVPWELVEKQECGGLKLYEDLQPVLLAKDFCEKKFG